MSEYTSARVTRGEGGWGGPLTITPTAERPVVASITGGGIHPVAQRIADVTGAEVLDGFEATVPVERMAVAVIDCGGTARIGVYPMKQVKTVDVHGITPSGPLSQFITEELFVSAVRPDDVDEA